MVTVDSGRPIRSTGAKACFHKEIYYPPWAEDLPFMRFFYLQTAGESYKLDALALDGYYAIEIHLSWW